jgi:16S rRNA (uracil1498-N3)-methyltransferase
MPVFFIPADQVLDRQARITGPLLQHLRDSLRIRPGEEIRIAVDRRHRYRLRVTEITRRALTGAILEEQAAPGPAGPAVTLAQAMLKGDRMDWIIQKATELGVAGIVPLVSGRVIARPRPSRLLPQRQRWQRIAMEAAQQSERWEIPLMAAPCEAAAFFAGHQTATLNLILSARGLHQSLSAIMLPCDPASSIAIAVGPEGGWTSEELGQALEQGFLPVTLGERILRSETAALAVLSILQSRLGELG